METLWMHLLPSYNIRSDLIACNVGLANAMPTQLEIYVSQASVSPFIRYRDIKRVSGHMHQVRCGDKTVEVSILNTFAKIHSPHIALMERVSNACFFAHIKSIFSAIHKLNTSIISPRFDTLMHIHVFVVL